jgi:hypothetical protein
MSTQQEAWAGKGGKPDKLGLVDRPANTAMAFVAGSMGRQVLAGTAYHKLLLYDSSVGKRPQVRGPHGWEGLGGGGGRGGGAAHRGLHVTHQAVASWLNPRRRHSKQTRSTSFFHTQAHTHAHTRTRTHTCMHTSTPIARAADGCELG